MSRRTLNIIGILILMGITAAVSVTAYIFMVGGSGEASAPITAPTLDLSTPTPNATETQFAVLSGQVTDLQATIDAYATNVAQTDNQIVAPTLDLSTPTPNAAETQVAVLSTQVADLQATITAQASQSESSTESQAAESTVVAQAVPDPSVYAIQQDGSTVTFTLTEDLRGQFTTVIGTTNQVAGEILVDFANPANSRIGQIRINARTLATDNEFRNRAIRGEILQSSQAEYEFIDFTPTALNGLPASIAIGEAVTFQIVGDLKIRNITQSVTFDVTATAVSEDRLEGTATTVVTRTQFDLQIPNVPSVTNVSDEVTLQINFVAAKSA